MKTFAEKLRDARVAAGMTMAQLAETVELSLTSIQAYEKAKKRPRQTTMLKLAKALNVSIKFLTDDNCEDPMADIEKDGYIEEARLRYGAQGARDINALLDENTALFAGGELSQAEKDVFFEAIMRAYITCKEEARVKFSPKNR